ncbi:TPA: Rid family hydrolase [Serratia odorifera]
MNKSKSLFKFMAFTLSLFSFSTFSGTETYTQHSSSIPVSTAVEISPPASVIYFSGRLPKVTNTNEIKELRDKFGGNTKEQALSVLTDLKKSLQLIGLDTKNIVKVQVFLVGDERLNNRMDIEGFSEAYNQFFSTKKNDKVPVRTLVQVAGLAQDGMLVEIEITAVRAG